MRKILRLRPLLVLGLLSATLALGGCSSSDGAPGASGVGGASAYEIAVANGFVGTEAEWVASLGPQGDSGVVTTAATESCVVCHGDGRFFSVKDSHAVTGKVEVLNASAAVSGPNVIITANIKVDGVNASDFTTPGSGNYHFATSDAAYPFYRATLTSGNYALAAPSAGLYTITVPRSDLTATTAVFPSGFDADGPITYLINLTTAAGNQATIVAGASVATPNLMARALAADTGCQKCHGTTVFGDGVDNGGAHHGAKPQGPSACAVCHTRDTVETNLVAPGSRLMGYVHGIHNSHNMPQRSDLSTTFPAGIYMRNNSQASRFSVSFPGEMRNCQICHVTPASLTAVLDAPVSWANCMSCHANWDGFTDTKVGGTLQFHRSMTAAGNCALCHDGATAPANVRAFHDGQTSARGGLLKHGKDLSVELGKNVIKTITGVTSTAAGVTQITWTAKNNGVDVNPCNTATTTDGAVSFQGTVLLRGYAQGNDWVNAEIGATPGQPTGELNVFTGTGASTTCVGNVATTTIPAQDPKGATKGVVGLGGKPMVRSAADGTTIAVRGPSVTREYVVATGALPATADQRRAIVSNAKCLNCHEGTIYQHGGTRIDSVEYCVICHNAASNDQWYRENIGVDATEAYDGKSGQTIDLRYMLHAIHSAGVTAGGPEGGVAIAFYRSNGIYVFGGHDSEASIPNWPGTGSKVVYGSEKNGTFPTPATLTHNFHAVTYPRSGMSCDACHIGDSEKKFNSKAVAVSVNNAGAAPWGNQLDDVLVSPSTAACMSCHQDTETKNMQLSHAYEFSWLPSVFEKGRQMLLDALK